MEKLFKCRKGKVNSVGVEMFEKLYIMLRDELPSIQDLNVSTVCNFNRTKLPRENV